MRLASRDATSTMLRYGALSIHSTHRRCNLYSTSRRSVIFRYSQSCIEPVGCHQHKYRTTPDIFAIAWSSTAHERRKIGQTSRNQFQNKNHIRCLTNNRQKNIDGRRMERAFSELHWFCRSATAAEILASLLSRQSLLRTDVWNLKRKKATSFRWRLDSPPPD